MLKTWCHVSPFGLAGDGREVACCSFEAFPRLFDQRCSDYGGRSKDHCRYLVWMGFSFAKQTGKEKRMKEKNVWSRRFFEIIEKLWIWQFDVIGPFVHFLLLVGMLIANLSWRPCTGFVMLPRQGNVEPSILLIGFSLWEVVAEQLVECWEPSSRIAMFFLRVFTLWSWTWSTFVKWKVSFKRTWNYEFTKKHVFFVVVSKFIAIHGHLGIWTSLWLHPSRTPCWIWISLQSMSRSPWRQETRWSSSGKTKRGTQVVQARLNKRCPRLFAAVVCIWL